jgi:8-oxo-dGTP pyrophosphatase MutT (NUDIX family)
VAEPCIRIPYALARTRASENGWREKVLAYITRRSDELLVFAHTEKYPDAGIQVPAGGVEPGEEPATAVLRETYEESGLALGNPVHLGSYEWQVVAPSRIRHFFWLQAPMDTPDQWEHGVSAGEEDRGMIFRYSFAPRSNPGLIESYGFGSGLADLERVITVLR